jgi:hypothetical protein
MWVWVYMRAVDGYLHLEYVFFYSILDIFLLKQTAFVFPTLKPYHTNDNCVCQNGYSGR